MGYTDPDGEYIIDTVIELREFIEVSLCAQCVSDAVDILAALNGKQVEKLVFSMKCWHVKVPPQEYKYNFDSLNRRRW